jgi:hypothetical protein
VPVAQAEQVRKALFHAGAGHIGDYSECSFNAEGTGTFKGGENSDPYVGEPGIRHHEEEMRIETVYPANLESKIIMALVLAHPYEEVAYDLYNLNQSAPANWQRDDRGAGSAYG